MQLLCEFLLFNDVSGCQAETFALLVEAVIVFGLDGYTLMACLLCLRAASHCGPRARELGETAWLASSAMRAFKLAEQYLLSEHVGSLTLQQIVAMN